MKGYPVNRLDAAEFLAQVYSFDYESPIFTHYLMDLFLHLTADSFLDRPVIDVNIFEAPRLFRNNDAADAGIDDYPFAKEAGNDLRDHLSGFNLDAHEVEIRPHHVQPGGMDYRVHLGVNRAAKFVVLAVRDVFCQAKAIPKVDTVGGLARRAIVARADYLIVFNDYGAESASEACAPHRDGTGDIYVILTLRRSFHFSLVEIISWM
jgi:hypothetical protein